MHAVIMVPSVDEEEHMSTIPGMSFTMKIGNTSKICDGKE
jgi:hypothetical protein